MTDVDRIAAAVTASGYPAEVDRVVGAAQLQNARAQASKLAKDYVAAVDDRLIPRQDYLTELNHAKNRYTEFYGDDVFSDARGQQVLESLKAQTGQRLVDEGIQLTAIRKTGFTIEQSDLDQAAKRFLEKRGTTVEEFKADLEKAGYSYAYFEKRFRNQTLIRAYQDEVLFSGAATDADKRQRYLRWFSDARRQASVVYYDPELTKLASGGGSCGGGSGSCCSAG
jgi:parvulin-like peptidyl-prolyl isomerase